MCIGREKSYQGKTGNRTKVNYYMASRLEE
jgi:hypothetical protein